MKGTRRNQGGRRRHRRHHEPAPQPARDASAPLPARHPPEAARPWLTPVVLAAFALVFAALQINSYRQKSATWDEPIHLTAGYLAAAQGDYRVDPSHPPLLRMWAALPLLWAEDLRPDTTIVDRTQDEKWLGDAYRFSREFLYERPDADCLLYAARFMVVLWGIALGGLVFLWAREWLGFLPAAGALAFYTLEPNIAAHTQLVTTDLAAACCIFATVYWLWRTCRQPTGSTVAGLATSFALAFATKFSAVLLLPIVGVLMAVAVARGMRLRLTPAVGLGAILLVSAWAGVWGVYGFRYAPSGTDGWLLQLQHSTVVRDEAPALGRVFGWLDEQRVLPNAYTQGFLMSQASARQASYLAGEYSDEGFWYYFPLVFLLKTPSALVLLTAAGVVVLVARRRQLGVDNALFVALPIVIYTAFAVASGINLGLRHLLPIYPFLLLIAAAAARWLATWRRPIGTVALAALVAYWGIRYASVYPHTLTYLSAFAGGPDHALAYVADSNLDWGQDLKGLKEWMRARNVERINLAYFGTADPDYYGIEGPRLPGTPFEALSRPELPGYVAISATILSGVYLEPHWRLLYNAFLEREPLERVGHSIYVFHVDEWPEDDDPVTASGALGGDDVQGALADALLFELDWPSHAVHHYRETLQRTPGDAAATEKLGIALLSAGRTDDAIPVLERAAVLDPVDGETRYRLALALLAIGRPQDAVAHADAATTLQPRGSAAHDLLGVALAATGRLDEAAQAFRRAIELAPGNSDAREHLRRLQDAAPATPRSVP